VGCYVCLFSGDGIKKPETGGFVNFLFQKLDDFFSAFTGQGIFSFPITSFFLFCGVFWVSITDCHVATSEAVPWAGLA